MGQAPWVLFVCDFLAFWAASAELASPSGLEAAGWAGLTLWFGWAAGHPGAGSLQALGGL